MKQLLKVAIAGAAIVLMNSLAAGQEKKIRRDQLPAAVEKTVAAQIQNATVKGFAREVENGQTFYELSLTIDGHNKDILMNPAGNIVEVEEQVNMSDLPSVVQDALKKAAGRGKIQVVESITKNGQLVAYEGHVRHGLKRSEIQVGPQGEKLKRRE